MDHSHSPAQDRLRHREGGIFRLLLILIFINIIILFLAPRFRFSCIVVHHAAAKKGDYASIRKFHRKHKGWKDAAYHLILSNGSTSVPKGHLEPTGRYRFLSYSVATGSPWHNLKGVHICVVGDYDKKPMSRDMRRTLAHALMHLQKRFDISGYDVLLHKDCNKTACPGRHITKRKLLKWIAEDARDCPPEIKKQQRRVIDRGYHSAINAPRILLFLLLIGLIGLAWKTSGVGRRADESGPSRTS